jgi:hypothetical protein
MHFISKCTRGFIFSLYVPRITSSPSRNSLNALSCPRLNSSLLGSLYPYIPLFLFRLWSRGSSVSIVYDYGLDDRAIGFRFPAEAKDFSSSLCVQTDSGAHPASYTLGTGGPFPGVKAWPGRDADHSPLSSAEVENE